MEYGFYTTIHNFSNNHRDKSVERGRLFSSKGSLETSPKIFKS